MTTVFAVSFAILWKQRQADPPSPRDVQVPVVAAPSPPAMAPGIANDARRDGSLQASVAAPADAAATSAAIDTAAEEMPVELHFRKRPDLGKIQGSVVNNSDAELVIEAVVFSPDTQETAKFQIAVAPYSGKPFGLDDGLDMHSGDRITLKSSPYRDKSGTIP